MNSIKKQTIEILQDEKKEHERAIKDIDFQFENTYWDENNEEDRRKYSELETIRDGHVQCIKGLSRAIGYVRVDELTQARWIYETTRRYDMYGCSNCGYIWVDDEGLPDYCPHCGFEMKEHIGNKLLREEQLKALKESGYEPYKQFNNNDWIDVKDRLPDKDGEYLVSFKYGDYVCISGFKTEDCNPTWDNQAEISGWMPLPKNYVRSGEDD